MRSSGAPSARAVDAEREEGRGPAGPIVAAVAGRIRANIAAILGGPSGASAQFAASLADLVDPEVAASAVARLAIRDASPALPEGVDDAEGTVTGSRNSVLSTLVEIHAGIVELAGGLGVAAASAPATGAASDQAKEPS